MKLMHIIKLLHCYVITLLNRKKQYNNVTIQQFNNAFTLIELLVVMSIIAILIAAASASFMNAQMKGRDGRRKSDLKSVQQALELYFQTYGRYPTPSSGVISCSGGAAGTGNNAWGSVFQCPPTSGPIFMQQLPKDLGSTAYYYNAPSNFTYVLSAALENTSDPDLTGLLCTPYAGPPARNFCVINP